MTSVFPCNMLNFRAAVMLGLCTSLAACGGMSGDRGIVSRPDAERREAAGQAPAAIGAETMASGSYTSAAPSAAAPAPVVQAAAPAAGRLGAGGQSAAQLDTTTEAERQAASAPAAEPAGEQRLGTTVASLGDPTQSGFWLRTPLVTATAQGRITYRGQSANVELRPLSGPASGGSQISLAAMQMLGIALTELPEIEVFRR